MYQNYTQAIILAGGDYGMNLIILGVILLAIGIILSHFFPNRYWIIVIAIGAVIAIVGLILLLLGTV